MTSGSRIAARACSGAPGGPNDLAVRPSAQKLREALGQPFVIDSRAGPNGVIGTDYVAKLRLP